MAQIPQTASCKNCNIFFINCIIRAIFLKIDGYHDPDIHVCPFWEPKKEAIDYLNKTEVSK